MECAAGHEESGQKGKATLYVVATPIGNLKDITYRAIEVLKAVDVIAAEDTRVTAKLLNHYGIASKKLIALHEHNEQRAAPRVIAELAAGRSVALASDAGTPAFSDPGARLVAAVREAGYPVVPIPGPNAAAAALSASGLAGPQFLFYGFLPAKSGERRSTIQALALLPYQLLFYEAPHRVLETITDLAAALGGSRSIVIARELTKLFETIHACARSATRRTMARRREPRQRRVRADRRRCWVSADDDAQLVEAERALVCSRSLPVKQAVALGGAHYRRPEE